MRHNWIRAVALAAAIALAPAAVAQPVTVTFNSATDINNFIVNDQNLGQPPPPTSGTGSVFTFDPAAGINDNGGQPGGGLITNGGIDATAGYVGPGGQANPKTFNLQTGATVSIMVKATTLPTDRFVQIGFMNQPSNALNTNAANNSNAFISVRLYPTERLNFQYKPAGSNTATAPDFQAATANMLTLNNWYRLSFFVQETSPTNFTATTTLDDFGASGLSLVSNLFTGTLPATGLTGFELSNGSLLSADGLGIAAMRQVTSSANFDQFQVTFAPVPEPSSLALVGVMACGLIPRLVRRATRRRLVHM
jgi:hypothetical protein